MIDFSTSRAPHPGSLPPKRSSTEWHLNGYQYCKKIVAKKLCRAVQKAWPEFRHSTGSFDMGAILNITRLIKCRNFGNQPMGGKIMKPTSFGMSSP
jgi:hypothetical protein